MIADINGTLISHLATAGGAAYILRARRPQLLHDAHSFVSARGDVKRLDAGQRFATEVLKKNDFDEMIALRDIVAQQELRRQIKYVKQKDHTAHTVCLYLLGLWLYDNLPKFRYHFARNLNMDHHLLALREADSLVIVEAIDNEFLFQWVYASLLHDVGYVFYDLSSETKNDRQAIDRLFSWDCVRALYAELSKKAEGALRNAYSEWERDYSQVNTLASFTENSFAEVLKFLADAPWVGSVLPEWSGKDLFAVLEFTQFSLLETYAFEVARRGYDQQTKPAQPCVDHAVASGLFLLRYTAFWYWLMTHVQSNSKTASLQITQGFNYDVRNLSRSVIPACQAVAFHNIQPSVPSASKIIPRLTLATQPLAFLSILCDELQVWDRSPAGRAHLDDYREYAKSALDGSDIDIMCEGPRQEAKARMVIRISKEVRKKFERRLLKTLDSRLPDWNQLISVEIASS